mmetsp:Transcript_11330/g.28708  ORF Transcript_11330/g.28708 Transcript_11330/m.28708 type:complete len:202 (-) Transcript_11330:923-1528(-)
MRCRTLFILPKALSSSPSALRLRSRSSCRSFASRVAAAFRSVSASRAAASLWSDSWFLRSVIFRAAAVASRAVAASRAAFVAARAAVAARCALAATARFSCASKSAICVLRPLIFKAAARLHSSNAQTSSTKLRNLFPGPSLSTTSSARAGTGSVTGLGSSICRARLPLGGAALGPASPRPRPLATSLVVCEPNTTKPASV